MRFLWMTWGGIDCRPTSDGFRIESIASSAEWCTIASHAPTDSLSVKLTVSLLHSWNELTFCVPTLSERTRDIAINSSELTSISSLVPQAVIQAMAKIASCRAGVLWLRAEDGSFRLEEEWMMTVDAEGRREYPDFTRWLQESGWIIDLKEWRETPRLYVGLNMPAPIASAPGLFLQHAKI